MIGGMLALRSLSLGVDSGGQPLPVPRPGQPLLGRLSRLTSLSLAGWTQQPEAAAAVLAEAAEGLAMLRYLRLEGWSAIGPEVGGFERLKTLSLARSDLSAEGVAAVAGIGSLRALRLSFLGVPSSSIYEASALEALSTLSALTLLECAGLRCPAGGLPCLQGMKGLRQLHLRAPIGLSDAFWPQLAGLLQLEVASVGPVHLPREAEVEAGSQAPRLTGQGLALFRRHRSVRVLTFRLVFGSDKVEHCFSREDLRAASPSSPLPWEPSHRIPTEIDRVYNLGEVSRQEKHAQGRPLALLLPTASGVALLRYWAIKFADP